MKKILFIVLLLTSAFALNLTVDCAGNCISYVPSGGNALLNYTVDGTQLTDVYTEMYEVNVSGDTSVINNLVRFDLTTPVCNNPSTAFLGLNKLRTSYLGDYLFAEINTTASNQTVKVFCSGQNTLVSQADWFGTENISWTLENMTWNGTRTLLNGLSFVNETEFGVGNIYDIGMGNDSFIIANQTGAALNITRFDAAFNLLNYTELDNATYVYTAFGNISTQNGDDHVFAISHGNGTWGNVTLLNATFDVVATFDFNDTIGIAIVDVDNDDKNEIVVCANITEYNITLIEYSGSWSETQTNMSCSGLGTFTRFNYSNMNESIITKEGSNLVLIDFNTSYPIKRTTALTNIQDLTSFDIDDDDDDEIAVLKSDTGIVELYNVTSIFAISKIENLLDLNLQKSLASNGTHLLSLDENISINKINSLSQNGSLTYFLNESVALKVFLNFSTGGTGTIYLNMSSEDWSYNNLWTSATDVSLTVYPNGNTTWINFTLFGDSYLSEPFVKPYLSYSNYAALNRTNTTVYDYSSFSPNTTILTDESLMIVGHDFRDAFYLEYFLLYLSNDTHKIDLNSTERSFTLTTPNFSVNTSSQDFSGTNPIQASQSESNTSMIIGFSEIIYFPTLSLNISTYNTTLDVCSKEDLFAYTWENATLFRLTTSVNELANITGNFSECYTNNSLFYFVNSSGGLETFNLSFVNVGNFTNSSFVLRDVVVADKIYGWNGTQTAELAFDNKFTLLDDITSEIFYGQIKYVNETMHFVSGEPALDLASDSMWEKLKSGVFSVFGTISKMFDLITGKYFAFGNNISVALDNGTFITYVSDLVAPTIGSLSSFTANTSYSTDWVAVNSSETVRINLTVTDFFENATDTINDFRLNCSGQTSSLFEKYSNHSFFFNGSYADGSYTCKIYPEWETYLPSTFATKEFTLYFDVDDPVIHDISYPLYVSKGKYFNIVINATEDSDILSATVIDNEIYAVPFTKGNIISQQGTYDTYTLPIMTTYPTIPSGGKVKLNITIKDLTGKISNVNQTVNITVYDSAAPNFETRVTIPTLGSHSSNNWQDYASIPVNISVDPISDANLSYINATLSYNGVLLDYEELTNINDDSVLFWFNRTLPVNTDAYTLNVEVSDITNNSDDENYYITRYDSQEITINGNWLSTAKTTEVGWINDEIYNEANAEDDDENITAVNEVTTFSIDFITPSKEVDLWYIKFNTSASNDFLKFTYEDTDETPENVNAWVYHATDMYAFNFSNGDTPTKISIKETRTVGEAEKICLSICNDYDLDETECVDDDWDNTNTCSIADYDSPTFNLDDTDFDSLGGETGYALKFRTVAITGTTTDDDDDSSSTTTTTSTAGSAVVSLTAPTSTEIEVGKCEDVIIKIKNTGTADASITSLSVSGTSNTEVSLTRLTSINSPHIIKSSGSLSLIYSVCPFVEKTFTPSICAKVGSTNKCISTKIKAVGASLTSTGIDDINLEIEQFGDEYIVFVNSTVTGPLEDISVSVIYKDGRVENYTTNTFGKFTFTPLDADFSIKLIHEGKTVEQTIGDLTEKIRGGFTIARIFLDLLIVAVLMGIGVLLDERMI